MRVINDYIYQPIRYTLERSGNHPQGYKDDRTTTEQPGNSYIYVHQGPIMLSFNLFSPLDTVFPLVASFILRSPEGVQVEQEHAYVLPAGTTGQVNFSTPFVGPLGITLQWLRMGASAWVATRGQFALTLAPGEQWVTLKFLFERQTLGLQQVYQQSQHQKIEPLSLRQLRTAQLERLNQPHLEQRLSFLGLPLGFVTLPYTRRHEGRPLKHEWYRYGGTGGAAAQRYYIEVVSFRTDVPWLKLTFPTPVPFLLSAFVSGLREVSPLHNQLVLGPWPESHARPARGVEMAFKEQLKR
jgi:hypothetical protein